MHSDKQFENIVIKNQVTVSVPARYIHSPASLISKSDLENAIKLVELAIINLDRIKL